MLEVKKALRENEINFIKAQILGADIEVQREIIKAFYNFVLVDDLKKRGAICNTDHLLRQEVKHLRNLASEYENELNEQRAIIDELSELAIDRQTEIDELKELISDKCAIIDEMSERLEWKM